MNSFSLRAVNWLNNFSSLMLKKLPLPYNEHSQNQLLQNQTLSITIKGPNTIFTDCTNMMFRAQILPIITTNAPFLRRQKNQWSSTSGLWIGPSPRDAADWSIRWLADNNVARSQVLFWYRPKESFEEEGP